MFGLFLASSSGSPVGAIVGIAIGVLEVVALWKVFTKAGEAGWKAIIPIWNYIVLLKIAGRPAWWIILFFLPIINFIALIVVFLDLAKSFGRSTGFGIGLILLSPIFLIILGFGSAQYVGPGGRSNLATSNSLA